MDNRLQTELFRATGLIFEQIAFLFPSSEVDEEQQTAPFEAAVEVEFRGAFGGRLVLALWGDVLAGIVDNMLGEEEERPKNIRIDALGELANVICGNFLSSVAGAEKVFLLSSPRSLSAKEVEGGKGKRVGTIDVGLEGGRAKVLLFTDNEIPILAREDRS